MATIRVYNAALRVYKAALRVYNAALRVYKTDGNDLWSGSPVSMSQIGALGSYYLERTTTNRITDGTAYVAQATATINGATRTTRLSLTRDAAS